MSSPNFGMLKFPRWWMGSGRVQSFRSFRSTCPFDTA